MGGEKNKEKIIKKIKEFKNKIKADKIIIFGSYVSGNFTEDSDIDLLLVSKKFRGKDFHERFKGLWLKWNLKLPVDFLCYTPEEFEKLKKGITIVREAVENGIEV
ncbi:MAG: nucleotidyltransferase domain-containing protein [Candidatus Thermoplasmatota archaeon]